MTKVLHGHATHPGKIRELNEDNFIADPKLDLWVVADGMGGHAAGEVASKIVVDDLLREVREGGRLSDAIVTAHHSVLDAGAERPGTFAMGSTVVALRLRERAYELSWVGDSRAYLWDGKQLSQLTKDHSFVQQLVDHGIISEDEAKTHPKRNVITRAVGHQGARGFATSELQVDTVEGILEEGQSILLCSDGLTGEVSTEKIERRFREGMSPQETADKLVEDALENGGRDNVTLIVVSARADGG